MSEGSREDQRTPQTTTGATGDNREQDGIDRRGFLKCMAWAGTGLLWTFAAGVPTSQVFASPFSRRLGYGQGGDFSFVQVSDSHIGFKKPANPDVTGTLQAAVDKITAAPQQPDFVLHTGDLTHSSKPAEFDTVEQVLKGTKKPVFYLPGEHDTSIDDGKLYLERHGKGTTGNGWYSFDHKGVHFAGLVNVVQLEGMGKLGQEQISWLTKDLAGIKSSTPVVLCAHIPLWALYPNWGWGTSDSEQALSLVRRFGSVTVLNGHIHQVMQKVEGNVTFHTATSTAFPQPAPGTAASPGPMKVASDRLRDVLGITDVGFKAHNHQLAIVDSSLKDKPAEEVQAEF